MGKNKEKLQIELLCAVRLFLLWVKVATNEELKHMNKSLKEIHLYMFDRREKKGGDQCR